MIPYYISAGVVLILLFAALCYANYRRQLPENKEETGKGFLLLGLFVSAVVGVGLTIAACILSCTIEGSLTASQIVSVVGLLAAFTGIHFVLLHSGHIAVVLAQMQPEYLNSPFWGMLLYPPLAIGAFGLWRWTGLWGLATFLVVFAALHVPYVFGRRTK